MSGKMKLFEGIILCPGKKKHMTRREYNCGRGNMLGYRLTHLVQQSQSKWTERFYSKARCDYLYRAKYRDKAGHEKFQF